MDKVYSGQSMACLITRLRDLILIRIAVHALGRRVKPFQLKFTYLHCDHKSVRMWNNPNFLSELFCFGERSKCIAINVLSLTGGKEIRWHDLVHFRLFWLLLLHVFTFTVCLQIDLIFVYFSFFVIQCFRDFVAGALNRGWYWCQFHAAVWNSSTRSMYVLSFKIIPLTVNPTLS